MKGDTFKKHLPLVFAIGLPAVVIVWIVLFSHVIPSITIDPQYSFVYVDSYYNDVSVVNDRIVYTECEPKTDYDYDCSSDRLNPQLYIYDTKLEGSRPISLEEALELDIVSTGKSPDGYSVIRDSSGGGDTLFFPFFYSGSGDRGSYITKDGTFRKQLHLEGSYYRFKLIGWIEN